MEAIGILLISISIAMLAGVSWWALQDIPKKPRKRRARKPYLCKCGETEPSEFYGTRKGKCKKCVNEESKERYRLHKEKKNVE